MNIRRATIKDANSIKEIFRTTVQKVNAKDYSKNQVEVWSNVADEFDWSTLYDTQKIWVVENEKEIMGFSTLKADGLLNLMYVHYNYQAVGVATLLENAVNEEAIIQKISKVWASVSITARPFFKSKGYKIVRYETKEKNGATFENAIMEKAI